MVKKAWRIPGGQITEVPRGGALPDRPGFCDSKTASSGLWRPGIHQHVQASFVGVLEYGVEFYRELQRL